MKKARKQRVELDKELEEQAMREIWETLVKDGDALSESDPPEEDFKN